MCNPPPELRIQDSRLSGSHNLRRGGLEARHTRPGGPIGSSVVLEVRKMVEADNAVVAEQSRSVGRRAFEGHCRWAWVHHKLACMLDTKVSQAHSPCPCPCCGGFST